MRTHSLFSLILTGLLLGAGILYAAVEEHRYNAGRCDNGKEWWSVTKYVNGMACEVVGVDCDGVRYSRDLNSGCRLLEGDPTAGVHTESGTGTNGGTWYARLRYDSKNRVIWIGGKDLAGRFYEIEISYDAPAEPGDIH